METIDGVAVPFKEGRRVAAAVADLSGDGRPELLMGNYAGGLAYFSGTEPPAHTSLAQHERLNARVWPNPTSGVLYVDCEQQFETVTIYNVFGQIVKDFHPQKFSPMTIDLSSLSAGIFFVNINNKYITKIVRIP